MVDQAKTADLILALGGDQLLMGQHERAIARFREAIRLDPNCSEAYAWLGKAYKEIGRFEEAERAFREAVRVRPDFALAHFNLGILYAAAGKKEQALEEYELLKTLHPIRAEKLLEQIREPGRETESDRPDSVDDSEKGESPVGIFNSSSGSGSGENHEPVDLNSVETVPETPEREIVPEEPYGPEGGPGIGDSRLDRPMDAEDELLSAEDEFSADVASVPFGGTLSPEIDRWKQAASADPQNAKVHWQLGRACLAAGEYGAALEAIEKAIANRRDFAGSHPESVRDSVAMSLALGECYERLGRFESAVGIYEQALDMDPDNAEAHFHLGMVAVVLSNRREAVDRYRSLARLDPDRAKPLLQRLLRVLSK